jgi:hypothetical protein
MTWAYVAAVSLLSVKFSSALNFPVNKSKRWNTPSFQAHTFKVPWDVLPPWHTAQRPDAETIDFDAPLGLRHSMRDFVHNGDGLLLKANPVVDEVCHVNPDSPECCDFDYPVVQAEKMKGRYHPSPSNDKHISGIESSANYMPIQDLPKYIPFVEDDFSELIPQAPSHPKTSYYHAASRPLVHFSKAVTSIFRYFFPEF